LRKEVEAIVKEESERSVLKCECIEESSRSERKRNVSVRKRKEVKGSERK
jgi:hypothetical protein